MAEVTDNQKNFIAKLVGERKDLLTPSPDWLKPPKTSWEASGLIRRLMAIKLPQAPEPQEGFYKTDAGVVFVYKARSGHLTSKTYNKTWEYTGKKGFAGCNNDTLLADKEVAELGRIIGNGKGVCVVCIVEGRDPTLTDARSIVAGYGATCAARFGWHYPSQQEAEATMASWSEGK